MLVYHSKIFYEMIKKKNNLSWSSKHKEIQYVKEEDMLNSTYYMTEAPSLVYKLVEMLSILMSLPPIAKWK